MFMYCICTQYLVGGSFALITVSIRRGMEVISLWHCWGGVKPRFLWQWPSAHLHFLDSCFSSSSWQYLIDSLCSGLVSLLFSQAHQHHRHLTSCWFFWQCGQVPNPAENEISIFKKLVSRRKHEVLLNFLVNGCSDVGFQKTQWTNTSRWHCTQIITDCGNLTLDFKQLGLWASPPFLQTLGPWFPNEIQNLLSSEKRTLDHWEQSSSSSLSPGKTPLMTTVAKFLDTSVCGALDALTPASVHSLWSSPKFLNRFFLTILIRLRFSRLVVHLFLPHFFLPLNFLLTCLDTALCEQLLW